MQASKGKKEVAASKGGKGSRSQDANLTPSPPPLPAVPAVPAVTSAVDDGKDPGSSSAGAIASMQVVSCEPDSSDYRCQLLQHLQVGHNHRVVAAMCRVQRGPM